MKPAVVVTQRGIAAPFVSIKTGRTTTECVVSIVTNSPNLEAQTTIKWVSNGEIYKIFQWGGGQGAHRQQILSRKYTLFSKKDMF